MNEIMEKYRWKGITVGIILFVCYAILFVLIPGVENVYSTYSHIREQQQQIESAENWESTLSKYKKQEEQLVAFLSELSLSASDNDHMSAIIELIHQQAKNSGIEVNEMRPLEKISNDTYSTLPFNILISGDFHEIARFANNLEQSQQLIKLSALTVSAPDKINTSYSLSAALEIRVLKIDSKSGREEEL